jgi:predicted PurR-regulated permease PerM
MDRNEEKKTGADGAKRSGARSGFGFAATLKIVLCAVALYVGLNHLGVIFGALKWVYGIFEPLLVGALLALILNTPLRAIEGLLVKISEKVKTKPSRRLIEIIALILTFLCAFLVIYIVGGTVIPQLVESIKTMVMSIQRNIPEFMKLLDELEGRGINTAPIEKFLSDIDVNDMIRKVTDNAINIINTILSSATSIVTGLFKAISAVVFAVYILANKKGLSMQIKKLSYAYLRKPTVDHACEICTMSERTFSDFISGQCLDAFILGMLMFITMSIFRFPYALAISVLIMVTALIPYIGAFLGGAFGVLLMIMDDPIRALLFIVLFIVVQQIDNHLIYPRVVGGSVGLPAIWTFAAVIIGGGLFGVLGMVLFIPVFSVFYTILKANVKRRLADRNIVLETDECEAEGKEEKPAIDFMRFDFMKKLKSKFTRLTEEAESEFDAASADSDGVEEAPTEADDDDDE